MNTNDKVIDITSKIKTTEQVDNVSKSFAAKPVTNPIMKKQFVVSVKNNIHRFSVSDLFD